MKTIIRRSSFGARVRIRPRRGMASRWTTLSIQGAAGPRAWARLPIALAWRRRRRERLVHLVRILTAATTPASPVERRTEVRRQDWLTVTRRFERHLSFESRRLTSSPPTTRHPMRRGRDWVVAVAAGAAARRHLPMLPLVERLQASMTRVSAPVRRESIGRGSPLASPARRSIRQPIVGSTRPRVASRSPGHSDVSGSSLQRPSLEARQSSWPTRTCRAISAPVVDAPSQRVRRVVPAVWTDTRRAASISAPPSPAAVVMMRTASPALVFRTSGPAVATPANPQSPSVHPAAPSEQGRFSTQGPSSAAGIPAAHAAAESVRSTLTPLSGPAMDRLAEDVMHRIERRIRIERERRGL